MIITLKLSPQIPCGDVMAVVVERKGEAIIVNGGALDLSFMNPGDSLPTGSIDHPLLRGASIIRDKTEFLIDGLLFHISGDQTDPAACFPDPVVITQDGPVSLPPQLPPPPSPSPI